MSKQLTEQERATVEAAAEGVVPGPDGLVSAFEFESALEKLLRCYDAQAHRILELEAKCGQLTRNALLDSEEWRAHVFQLESKLRRVKAALERRGTWDSSDEKRIADALEALE